MPIAWPNGRCYFWPPSERLRSATFCGWGRGGNTPGYQDALAALSLVAMLGFVAESIIIVFINPSLLDRLDLRVWEAVLTAAVAFYFGARS